MTEDWGSNASCALQNTYLDKWKQLDQNVLWRLQLPIIYSSAKFNCIGLCSGRNNCFEMPPTASWDPNGYPSLCQRFSICPSLNPLSLYSIHGPFVTLWHTSNRFFLNELFLLFKAFDFVFALTFLFLLSFSLFVTLLDPLIALLTNERTELLKSLHCKHFTFCPVQRVPS